MSDGRLVFELGLTTAAGPARRPSESEPMRILVLANLSGAAAPSQPLAERRVRMIDVDSAARVFARLAPRLSLSLQLPGAEAETIELTFGHPDDFHPDRLLRRVSRLAGLWQQREALVNPATFAQAAMAAGQLGPAAALTAQPAAESDADTLARLLGRAPEPREPAATDVVGRLLRQAVGDQAVPDTAGVQSQVLACHDLRLAECLRAILHHPDFQRLEATWRSVWKLANELETGDRLQIGLLDIRREELDADLRDHADDLGRSALCGVLRGVEDASPDSAAWSLLVCDERFGPDERDLTTLAGLGLLARRAGAPLLAAASPALFGGATLQDLLEKRPDPEAVDPRWRALRASPCAEWIGLALPRVLSRLPYGARTDPIEAFPFEEFDDEPRHEHYLWGNPAYALGFLAGRGFVGQGWEMRLDDCLVLDDLPSHVLRDDQGESHQQPCAEALLSEAVAEAVLEQGIMPLQSYKSRNAARLLRWQSIADPPRRLAGPWN